MEDQSHLSEEIKKIYSLSNNYCFTSFLVSEWLVLPKLFLVFFIKPFLNSDIMDLSKSVEISKVRPDICSHLNRFHCL